MQIVFNNWDISVKQDQLIVQGDNLSELVTVEGELPGEYTSWSLLLQANGYENVIPLGVINAKPGVYLTSEMLPYGGIFYDLQLRGECDEMVKHSYTNRFYVYAAVAGDGTWPEVPTNFSQMEARLRELNEHPPVPDENGEVWDVWDPDRHEYVVSEYPLPEGGEGSAPVRGTDYWTEADIAAIKGYVDDAILGGAW